MLGPVPRMDDTVTAQYKCLTNNFKVLFNDGGAADQRHLTPEPSATVLGPQEGASLPHPVEHQPASAKSDATGQYHVDLCLETVDLAAHLCTAPAHLPMPSPSTMPRHLGICVDRDNARRRAPCGNEQ